jgi:hypothetical protein
MLRTLVVSTVLLAGHPSVSSVPAPVGDWQGVLTVGASTLHLVLHVLQEKEGLSASLDSPDQGVTGVVISEIVVKDGKLMLTIDVIAGTYTGTISTDGMSIDGTWAQGDQTAPLVFKRVPPPDH